MRTARAPPPLPPTRPTQEEVSQIRGGVKRVGIKTQAVSRFYCGFRRGNEPLGIRGQTRQGQKSQLSRQTKMGGPAVNDLCGGWGCPGDTGSWVGREGRLRIPRPALRPAHTRKWNVPTPVPEEETEAQPSEPLAPSPPAEERGLSNSSPGSAGAKAGAGKSRGEWRQTGPDPGLKGADSERGSQGRVCISVPCKSPPPPQGGLPRPFPTEGAC